MNILFVKCIYFRLQFKMKLKLILTFDHMSRCAYSHNVCIISWLGNPLEGPKLSKLFLKCENYFCRSFFCILGLNSLSAV